MAMRQTAKTQATKRSAPVKKAATVKKTSESINFPEEDSNEQERNQKRVSASGDVGRCGNVGSITELQFSSNGTAWIRFSLAYTPYDFQKQEQGETVWYDCTCFRSLAENVAAVVETGMRVVVSGQPEVREYVNAEGETVKQRVIICDGVGPDLRFATASVQRTFRRQPNQSLQTTGLLENEEPF